jgi:hypothetical protein
MIGLHRKMDDPKPGPSRVTKRSADCDENDLLAQTRKAPHRS